MDTPLRCTARPDGGGSTRGVSAERFETPLVGGAAWFWRRGGNPPAPACPRRGKRERGGIQIPCCRRRLPPGLPPEVALRRSLPQVFTATRKPEFPFFVPTNLNGFGHADQSILSEMARTSPWWMSTPRRRSL